MKIRLLNVKYSSNVGDGVIAECLEREVSERIPGVDIQSVDLGGRVEFTSKKGLGKGYYLYRVLGLLPLRMDRFLLSIIATVIVPFRLRNFFSCRLNNADAVIIGGGQLIQSTGNYFSPRLKVSLATIPNTSLHIYGVGVQSELNKNSVKQFLSIFRRHHLRTVGLRDNESKLTWERHFCDQPIPAIALDPGLLSARVYGNFLREPNGTKTISIGITAIGEIKAHSTLETSSNIGSFEFYKESIIRLSKEYQLKIFTNGADADHLVHKQLIKYFSDEGNTENVIFIDRPIKPIDLVECIATSDLVISHRLHANIVSFSYGIPSIGFFWDKKLESFFKLIERENFFVAEGSISSEELLALVVKGLKTPIDPLVHRSLLSAASESIDLLVNNITAEEVI